MSEGRVTGTWHTGITVADLDRSIAFFREVLGLELVDRVTPNPAQISKLTGVPDPEIEIAFLKAPDHTIELLCFRNVPGRRTSDLKPSDGGFFHLAFFVDDLDAVLEKAEGFGFRPIGEAVTVPTGPRAGWRICYARDAEGATIEFAEKAEVRLA